MPNSIFILDRQLLLLINHLPHNVFTDSFFLFFSVAGLYGLVWFLLTITLIVFDGIDNRRELGALTIAVLFELVAVEVFLKNVFLRIRPERVLSLGVIRILQPLNSYSFPSGHATIAFAAAYILSIERKHFAWLFYLLAVLVSVSRVYLGRHYPTDVMAGALLGILIGIVSSKLVWSSFPEKRTKQKRK